MKTYNALDFIKNLSRSVVPEMHYDGSESLETWQQIARTKLKQILGLPFQKCEDLFEITGETSGDIFKKIDFEFQSEPGYFVRGNLLVPNEVIKPNRTMICIQGHTPGKHVSLGIEKYPRDKELIAGDSDFAIRAVKEGFCAAVIDQRYMGEAGAAADGGPYCVRKNAAMATLLLGRCAVGERVWDVQRLIDILTTYFSEYVDRENLMCMGNSGGGTTTFYAACVDQRIKLAMPSCAVCSFEKSIIDLHHCSCNYVPKMRKYFEMGDLGCLIAPRMLVIVCGIKDDIFPLEGVEESFNIIKTVYKTVGKEEFCHLVKGSGGHQFYADDAWPVVHECLKKRN